MKRQNLFDGTEVVKGYARAVRVGPHVWVSGTTSADRHGNVVGKDLYEQSKATIAKIDAALQQAGASLKDVVRLTIFCTRMDDPSGFVRAMEEDFGEICPASALIGTPALLRPEMLVEIEADAFVTGE